MCFFGNILLTITLADLHRSVNTIYENCKYLQLLRFTVKGNGKAGAVASAAEAEANESQVQ